MATYKGNVIGDSRTKGLFSKFSEEGTEMRLLKYRDFLDGVGRAPYVTKDIDKGEPTEHDSWFKLYVNTSEEAVRHRLEDTARITKFIATPKGVLWESRMAGLETMQKGLQQKTEKHYQRVQTGNQSEDPNFWQKLGNVAANLGKSVLQGIGLTASTLSQVAASGTGFRADTYISRAYLINGKASDNKTLGVLNSLLSYAGITNGGKLNGAEKVLGGAIDVLGSQPWTKLANSKNSLVPEDKIKPKEIPTHYYGSRNNTVGSPRNYQGEFISVENPTYSAADLHGVSKATKASRPRAHNINSSVRKTDIFDLVENPNRGKLYGDLKATQSLARHDPLETLGITSGSHGEKERADISALQSERVARLYDGYLGDTTVDSEKYRYINSKTVKNTRMDLNRDPENKVFDYLGVDKVKLGEKGDEKSYLEKEGSLHKSDGTVDSFFKEKFPIGTDAPLQPRENEWAKPTEDLLQVKLPKVRNEHKRDKIEEFLYENVQEPDIKLDSDLQWKEDNLDKKLGLVPFCITTITPDHRSYLNFPAYLESYEDQYNGDWDSVQYVGRADRFWGYKGFTRSINIGFRIAAKSRNHLIPIYKKLNRLVGVTAPSYGKDALFMRGTMASITIGGYRGLLPEQLGIIQDVRLSWKQDYLWELGDGTTGDGTISYGEAGQSIIVPQVLDVSLTLKAIEKQEAREDYGAYMVWNPRERIGVPAMPSLSAPATTKAPELAPPKKSEYRFDKAEAENTRSQIDNTSVARNPLSNEGNIRGGNQGPYDTLAPGAEEIARQQQAQFGR